MKTLTYSLNNSTLSLASEVVAASGGLISFTKWVATTTYDLKDKDEKKLANARYSELKKEFYRETNKIVSAAVADDRLNARRATPKFNKDGEFVGLDASFRVPTKTEMKKDAAARETSALAAKDAENAALRAELAALRADLAAKA